MIRGEHIRLRPIEKDDLPQFVAWFQDDELREGLGAFLPFSLSQEEQWFERMRNRSEQASYVQVIEAPTPDGGWVMIGSCSLENIDWRNRHAELGIGIGAADYRNKGYGTDTVKALVRHAFQTLNLNKVWLRVFAYNKRAVRAYEKAGFTVEGCMRQDQFRFGEYHDTIYMSILRQEWSP